MRHLNNIYLLSVLFLLFSARFSTLLFIEELAIEAEVNSFRLHSVTLTRRGSFLVLHVPGLSDGKPSLIVGVCLKNSSVTCVFRAAQISRDKNLPTAF